MVHQAMLKAGVDVDAVYTSIGFNPEFLNRPGLRTLHEAQVHFWETVESVTGDPDIGLHLAPHVPVYSGDVFEYLFFSSPTYGEGARRAIKYLRLASDAFNANIEHDDREAWTVFEFSTRKHPALRHSEVCILYALVRFLQSVSGGAFRARRVEFQTARPANAADYEKLFGCPVMFDQPDSRLVYARELLDRQSPHSEPELAELHEELASRQLSRLQCQDVVDEVRRVLSRGLENQGCTLNSVAAELDMTPRRLREELARAGTSFNHVVADFRYSLARRLLAQTDEPIQRIVYLTGFSEISTFYRAFRRWSGQTPVQYRRRKRPDADGDGGDAGAHARH
jgi:AraC-like DNA-binding protein